MLYYLTAAAIVLHTYFWGCGLAWLVLPRRWRPFWWAYAPGLGLALQSAVVWAGAMTPVRGTNAYVWWSELLPAGLAVWAVLRRGVVRLPALPRLLAVPLLMAATGWLLLSPMAERGAWTLTSSSLGSNDHADYAAGARVFQEFSKDDREGFLGLSEVTRVGSAEYFFDYWRRLNHFTPSAVMAHNGAMLGLEPYQLVSLSGAVLVLLNLPLALLLARVAVGLRGAGLFTVGLLYGVSPLTAYGVHHGALGQFYAAQGIALLTLVVMQTAGAARRREGLGGHGLLISAAIWLLAGSYNFILTVALAPAAGWLLLEAWRQRVVRPALRTGLVVAGAAAGVVLAFWGRFDGMIERFRLFAQYDFGWAIPLLTPEGWLGVVRGTFLRPWPPEGRWLLIAAVVALWVIGVVALARRRSGAWVGAVALVLPVAAGWAMLAWEAQVRANASYDAYKLLAVFQPGLLAGLCGWAAAAWSGGRRWRIEAGVVLVVLLAANLSTAQEFRRRMANPPLRVERAHVEVGRLERESRIGSLNLLIESFWARLWTNAFLLRKPHYFPTHTYEARLNTELRGEWNLVGSLVRSEPLQREDLEVVNGRFHAVRVGAPGLVEATFGAGWHQTEGLGVNRWRWTMGEAELLLNNPSAEPLKVRLTFRGRAVSPRTLQPVLNGRPLRHGDLGDKLETLELGVATLPPGRSLLLFRSNQPPREPDASDSRDLDVALHGLVIRALPR